MRTWLLALFLTLITIFVGLLFGLRVAQRHADRVLMGKAEQRGWTLEHTGLQINLAGRARMDEACVSFGSDTHYDLCVEGLVLQLRPLALLRKRVHIQDLRAFAVRVDSTLDRLATLRSPSNGKDSGPEEASEASLLPVLKRARIDHVDLRISEFERAFHVTLSDLIARPDHGQTRVRSQGELVSFESGSEGWAHSLGSLLERTFHLEFSGSLEDGLQAFSVRFDERLTLRLPGDRGVELSTDGVSFQAPYTVSVHAPLVRFASPALTVHAEEIEASVGVWTRHVPNFYFTSLTAHAPTLTMRAQDLSLVRALFFDRDRAVRPEDGPSLEVSEDARVPSPALDGEGEDVHHDSTAEPSQSGDVLDGLLAQLLHERTWWEVLPRAIALRDGSVQLTGEDGASIRLQNLDAEYAVRALHQQMDLEIDADLLHNEAPAGTIDARLEWNYSSEIGRLFWDVQDFSLRTLSVLVPSGIFHHLDGAFESEGRWRIDQDHQVSGAHRTQLKDLKIRHPRFTEDIDIPRFSIAGSFDHRSINPELVARKGEEARGDVSADGAAPWVLKNQEVRLGDRRATLQVELTGVRPFQRPRVEGVFVDLEIPRQPAMALFEAIPDTIRGPLRDAKMQGEWGLRLAFEIDSMGIDEQGRPIWEIRTPSTYQVDDKDLALLSLPEAVDVQRLNGEMEFVFRGPDDGFMRPIHIPSPAKVQELAARNQEEGVAHASGAKGDSAHAKRARSWVPLQEMSFYFIATQLYREDGSFFRNSGINWLQIRHVLSDALTTGRVSRGASTITMQTVKNLFLTHEKSAERKLQELFLTYWMTRTVPKDRILDVYLNVIELCPHCNGADEASRFHFDTPIDALDIRSSVWLSTISPNPTRLGGKVPKQVVGWDECRRCDQILRGLHARGWINAREFRNGTVDPQPKVMSSASSDRDVSQADGPSTEDVVLRDESMPIVGEDTQVAEGTDATSSEASTPQDLPWVSGANDGVEDESPLLDMLLDFDEDGAELDADGAEFDADGAEFYEDDEEFDEDGNDFERLSVEERLEKWIEEQRPVRGPN